jgi:myo-inositol 2-dehydrogenase/D-chiro-inositol 1-dehydrogenase
VPRDHPPSVPRLSLDDLARAFLVDLDLLRFLGGEYDQVTAIRSGEPPGDISLQTITLSGGGLPKAIWTAAPASTASWRATVIGDSGTATLAGNPQNGTLTLESRIAGQSPSTEETRFDLGNWQLSAAGGLLESARRMAPGPELAAEESHPPQTWDDFTRAAELFEAIERSIRRRRTIEIHFESHSERGQFKTHMTAAGCSLLTLTFLAVIAYLTAAALIELPPVLKKILVGLIFLPLGLFLALQALIVLARPSNEGSRSPSLD